MTRHGSTRPDGTIVPRDPEWSIATQDGHGIAWDVMTAPVSHLWHDRRWVDLNTVLTLFPTDAETRALPELEDDDAGRVVIEVPAEVGERGVPEEWTTVTTLDGRDFDIRRAACGAGCRCAAEIRSAQ